MEGCKKTTSWRVHKRKPSNSLNPNSHSCIDSGLNIIGLVEYRTVLRGHGVGQAIPAKADLVESNSLRRAITGDLRGPSIVSLHQE